MWRAFCGNCSLQTIIWSLFIKKQKRNSCYTVRILLSWLTSLVRCRMFRSVKTLLMENAVTPKANRLVLIDVTWHMALAAFLPRFTFRSSLPARGLWWCSNEESPVFTQGCEDTSKTFSEVLFSHTQCSQGVILSFYCFRSGERGRSKLGRGVLLLLSYKYLQWYVVYENYM